MDSLNKAFQILGELMNEDCFDFLEVASSNFEERKEYLRDMIFTYFSDGEVDLAGVIYRVDSGNEDISGRASVETVENINNFFKNKKLVADVILLMDEDMYSAYEKEINLR